MLPATCFRGLTISIGNEETTGSLFEVQGGWAAQTRWQRAGGFGFPAKKELTPEAVISKWNVISDFGKPFLNTLGIHMG